MQEGGFFRPLVFMCGPEDIESLDRRERPFNFRRGMGNRVGIKFMERFKNDLRISIMHIGLYSFS